MWNLESFQVHSVIVSTCSEKTNHTHSMIRTDKWLCTHAHSGANDKYTMILTYGGNWYNYFETIEWLRSILVTLWKYLFESSNRYIM